MTEPLGLQIVVATKPPKAGRGCEFCSGTGWLPLFIPWGEAGWICVELAQACPRCSGRKAER